MCGYCRPFKDKPIPLNGAIKASISFADDPEPMYVLDVEHWEEVGNAMSVAFRRQNSHVEIPVSFCPKCGRNLRGGAE